MPKCVGPTLLQKTAVRRAALWLHKGVVVPGRRRINVKVSGHDVEITDKCDTSCEFPEQSRVSDQSFEPGKLVVEFRPGLRIAVRQIDAADNNAINRSLDVTALLVRKSPGSSSRLTWISCPRDKMATPFQVFWPFHAAWYPAFSMASSGNASCSAFSSCRQTMSGLAVFSQASSCESRLLMLLMLNVAIFTAAFHRGKLANMALPRPVLRRGAHYSRHGRKWSRSISFGMTSCLPWVRQPACVGVTS